MNDEMLTRSAIAVWYGTQAASGDRGRPPLVDMRTKSSQELLSKAKASFDESVLFANLDLQAQQQGLRKHHCGYI